MMLKSSMNSIKMKFEQSFEELFKEHMAGAYKRMSFCPSYLETKAYRDAYNALVKGYYPPQEVEEHLLPPINKMLREHEAILEEEQYLKLKNEFDKEWKERHKGRREALRLARIKYEYEKEGKTI